ncbi:MAG: chondroitinase-B domain-containing protein [Luteolibacter sp.]
MKNPYPLFLAFSVLSLAHAAEYTVDSASEFNALSLSPGDTVTWTDGVYSDGDNISFTADGTSGNPITLKAETPGGVQFTGGMTIDLSADYVTVTGFYWNGGEGQNNHVEFRKGSIYANHSTIRNCAFNDLTPSGTDKHRWIVFYGTHNTVEDCSFVNKRSPGALLLVELEYNDFTPVGHIIRNNYFFNYEYRDPATTHSGDSETIRVGTSEFQDKSASVLVENNYFQACDGENEIITNKSANNTYKHNTFRNCHGSLVLRHGANAWVEGNFFLGEEKASSGGVRVSDSFHTIINNYFQDLNNDGDQWNNAITLVGGADTSGGTTNGYQKVDGILVAFNTIYNCDDPLYYNDRSAYDPRGVFAHNLVYSTRGTHVAGDISGTGQFMTYTGNIFGGDTIGITDSGITSADANFSASGEIYKPSSTGPAANSAGSAYSATVTHDIEGFTRPITNMDVGAHEVSGGTGSALYAPHTDSIVGVEIGASFLNAAGAFVISDGEFLSLGALTSYPSAGGDNSFSVSTNEDWVASESASWFSITPTTGSGSGNITVSVLENPSTSSRSANITVVTANLTRTITVTQQGYAEPIDVTGVTLTPSTATISVGATEQLTAEIAPADADIQWVTYASSNTAVATVSSTGEVTGVAEGTSTITVTTDDGGFTDTSAITVQLPTSGSNLALNKPVSGDEPQAENPLTHINDGDASNRYSVENYPKSVIVDLGAVYNIDRTEIVFYNGRAYQYNVEVATIAAGAYTQIIDRTGNTAPGSEADPLEDLFTAVHARYVKLTVTGVDAATYTGAWISVNEFRVFGEAISSASAYETWLEGYPGITDISIDGDPDGDGVPTLIEYVTGRSPDATEATSLFSSSRSVNTTTITISRKKTSTSDTTQTLQYCSDLASWLEVSINDDSSAQVSITSIDDNFENVEITIDDSEVQDSTLYWRIKVEPTT